jgi:hypothetical protein
VAVLTPNLKIDPCPLQKLEDACALFEVKASCASIALVRILVHVSPEGWLTSYIL